MARSKAPYNLCHFYSFEPLAEEVLDSFRLYRPDVKKEDFEHLRSLGIFFYRTSLPEMNNEAIIIQPEDNKDSYYELINKKDFTAYKGLCQLDSTTGKIFNWAKLTAKVQAKRGSDHRSWITWNEKKYIKEFDTTKIVEF